MEQGVNQENVNIICCFLIDQYVDEVQLECEEKNKKNDDQIAWSNQVRIRLVYSRIFSSSSIPHSDRYNSPSDYSAKARHQTMIVYGENPSSRYSQVR